MLTIIRYVLMTALRDRLFIGVLAGIAFAAGVSALLGGTAFLEEREMTVALAAGASRLMVMTGLIVFVCFHIRGAFESKEIDVILSRPVSRAHVIVAYWLGFALVAWLIVLPVAVLIGALGAGSGAGFFGWSASLLLESFIVVALALFSAFALSSAVLSVLACMGLYALSRMMAFFILTSQSGMVGGDTKYVIMRHILELVSTVVPRLDLFAKSRWLIYGFDGSRDWAVFTTQALIFVPLLLAATIIDFRRKEF